MARSHKSQRDRAARRAMAANTTSEVGDSILDASSEIPEIKPSKFDSGVDESLYNALAINAMKEGGAAGKGAGKKAAPKAPGEPEQKAEPAGDPDGGGEAEPEPEAPAEAKPEPEPEPETAAEPEAKDEPEPEPDAEAKPEPEAPAEPEAKDGTETGEPDGKGGELGTEAAPEPVNAEPSGQEPEGAEPDGDEPEKTEEPVAEHGAGATETEPKPMSVLDQIKQQSKSGDEAVDKAVEIVEEALLSVISSEDGPKRAERLASLSALRNDVHSGKIPPEGVADTVNEIMDDGAEGNEDAEIEIPAAEQAQGDAETAEPEPEEAEAEEPFESPSVGEPLTAPSDDEEAAGEAEPEPEDKTESESEPEGKTEDKSEEPEEDESDEPAEPDAKGDGVPEGAEPIDLGKVSPFLNPKLRERKGKDGQAKDKPKRRNVLAPVGAELKDVFTDWRGMTWPSAKETAKMSVAVVIALVVFGAATLGVDTATVEFMKWFTALRP